ncbi:MAG: DUF1573 domain-containing protein [Bacteroidetes bacterium]|nr:DUF1573 domain-containing protein [Bacteroidota bacterium]
MKQFIFLVITIAAAISVSFAQQKGANLSFEKETHNFGKMDESKGTVSYTFNFTNTGSEPLFILSVQPSCGCTTPEWSKEPVVPGGKGFIKATFNPAGRPGPFVKSINVVSNSATNSVILKISGEVIGKESTVEGRYPFKVDNLRFSSLYISYGKLAPGKVGARTLEIMNTGSENIAITFPNLPPYVEIMVNPSTLKPKSMRCHCESIFHPDLSI